jgi:hypothetical protein
MAKINLIDTQFAGEEKVTVTKDAAAKGSAFERDFHVIWNGIIDGAVKDEMGAPAQVYVQLIGPKGEDLAPNVDSLEKTDGKGIFQFKGIPPRRYMLVVNPYGPDQKSPFATTYFPSTPLAQDAHVFELSKGQHLDELNFSLQRLVERKIPIRITTTDGHPVKNPWVWIVYKGSVYFPNNPQQGGGTLDIDENGMEEISVFGEDLPVWVFAEDLSNNDSLISAPVEMAGRNLPKDLHLTLNLSKSQFKELWPKITNEQKLANAP